jgi:hypothetical protein
LRHAVHTLPDVMMPILRATEPLGTSAFGTLEPRVKMPADDLAWWTAVLARERDATV